MSVDESLFAWFYRRWRSVVDHATRSTVVPDDAPSLDDSLRWTWVASLLAGRRILVEPCREIPGWSGERFLVPQTTLHTDSDAREALTLILFGVAALKRGWGFSGEQLTSVDVAIGLVTYPTLRADVMRLWPSSAALLERWEADWLTGAEQPDTRSRGVQLACSRAAAQALAQIHAGSTTDGAHSFPDLLEQARSIAASWPVAPRKWVPRPAFPWIPFVRDCHYLQESAATDVPDDSANEQPPTSQRETHRRENVKRLPDMEDALLDNPAVHSFEKVHTLDDYLGGRKRMDGADEMDTQAEAMDELDLGRVVRSTTRARSLFRSDTTVDGAGSEATDNTGAVGARVVLYDEWDGARRRYRSDWCTLHDSAGVAGDEREGQARLMEFRQRTAATTRDIRSRLEWSLGKRRVRPRQPDGTELDLDAVVRWRTELGANSSDGTKLYLSSRRHAPDLSVLLLLDGSLSTDAWIDNRRFLDVAHESLVALADALAGLPIPVAVASFFSRARTDCRYHRLKEFDDPWDKGLRGAMAMKPTGYTRMGPAIRHASTQFECQNARTRYVIMVTDGKPTDYDRYEGSYGVADVRQAVREAARLGIQVHGIGIDRRARVSMNDMFGAANCHVVSRLDQLPSALGRMLGKGLV